MQTIKSELYFYNSESECETMKEQKIETLSSTEGVSSLNAECEYKTLEINYTIIDKSRTINDKVQIYNELCAN